MPEKLGESAILDRLDKLDGWILLEDRPAIFKQFVFQDFVQAFSFMGACALHCEKLDHHPEWTNVYKTVSIALTTHSANGVTELDFKLAQKMEALAPNF